MFISWNLRILKYGVIVYNNFEIYWNIEMYCGFIF